MSRKTRSFAQLIAYMDSEKSDRLYDIHHNCFARSQSDIARAFLDNSALLRQRKNGNILYHEILSITLEEGVTQKYAKDCLRDIAQEYVNTRCPHNMVYGCLHEDHADHLHYHLMISANPLGERDRLSLRKNAFEAIKRDLEEYVLTQYPELKQRRINTLTAKEKGVSRKAAAQKRRTGTLERNEEVKRSILEAMMHTTSAEVFAQKLQDKGYQFYQRGKHYGVKVQHEDGKQRSYRFATLGIHETYVEFESVISQFEQAEQHKENASQDQARSDSEKDHQGDAQEETREQTEKKTREQDQEQPHEDQWDDQGAEREGDEGTQEDAPAQEAQPDRLDELLGAFSTQPKSEPQSEPEQSFERDRPRSFLQEMKELRARKREKRLAKTTGKRRGKPQR